MDPSDPMTKFDTPPKDGDKRLKEVSQDKQDAAKKGIETAADYEKLRARLVPFACNVLETQLPKTPFERTSSASENTTAPTGTPTGTPSRRTPSNRALGSTSPKPSANKYYSNSVTSTELPDENNMFSATSFF